MTNEDLGYNDIFEESRKSLELDGFGVARVISESKGAYKVKNSFGEYRAKITGKQIFNASSREDYPAVGDWAAITKLSDDQAVINALLPRQTILKRNFGDKDRRGRKVHTQVIATNIDIAFIIESVDRDYNLNRFERYFSILENGGAKPAIILNKIDLLTVEDLDDKTTKLKERFPNIDIILTSVVKDKGLDDLKKYLTKNKTYCFLGSSGVGKSSLINKLLDGDVIKTGDISSYSNRGMHTTTARQMYFLKSGAIVIDNPGIREVAIADGQQGVDIVFDDIVDLAKECKFVDCTHTHEPGCKVLEAVKSKKIDEEKYQNYINLKKETDFRDLSDNEKREKDRKFGKFLKKAKRDIEEFGI